MCANIDNSGGYDVTRRINFRFARRLHFTNAHNLIISNRNVYLLRLATFTIHYQATSDYQIMDLLGSMLKTRGP